MYLILLSVQRASLEHSGQIRMGYWHHLDGQWTKMNVQWALLDAWWKNWMGMSGQHWVDSGNQKHSDLD